MSKLEALDIVSVFTKSCFKFSLSLPNVLTFRVFLTVRFITLPIVYTSFGVTDELLCNFVFVARG